MTIISGFNFSTVSQTGIAFDICWTINMIRFPEYPLPPFAFGTQVTGLDNSLWCFSKPAGAYAVGTVGYIDTKFSFTALTTSNASGLVGSQVGVMSQVASVVAVPNANNYDGIWVQIGGASPAVSVTSSTTSFAQLYSSTTAGALTSTAGGQPVNSVVTTVTSVGAGNQPGVISI